MPDPQHPLPFALPAYLDERAIAMNGKGVDASGAFVLCWLHHAIRAHENPVLDAAITLGNDLRKPVLVYQGLGGRHRFNSDRHHVFIMQGARDLQRDLSARGIAYAFYLPRDPSSSTPLGALIERSCAVITEDFPAPPFPAWTRGHASRSPVALVALDGACLLPVRALENQPTRAYSFRDRAQDEWAARIDRPWTEIEPVADPYPRSDLEFVPTDLHGADIEELAMYCDIDHTVPPVAHAIGGSDAGYARWDAFVRSGLTRYASRRNDALDDNGVSRLSPYLHHGHVSPFRIAREAHAVGGKGGEKFLDELLTWRELAYHFCAHQSGNTIETLRALPAWARDTLDAHRDDARETIQDWDTMRRGRTGDALWDAAQHALLKNGALHNNVRMTWGKMIPQWTRTPEEALRVLIDLNHRDALDGNNPNSYAGLLWCLGLFDRPFTPGTQGPRCDPRAGHGHARAAPRSGALRERRARPLGVRATARAGDRCGDRGPLLRAHARRPRLSCHGAR